MNRERLLPVVLALVCVVALAFVAASVVDPSNGAGSGSTVTEPTDGDDRNSGAGGPSGREPLTDPGQFVVPLGVCVPFLLSGEFFALVAGVVLLLWSVLAYRGDSFAATAVVVSLGFPAFFVWMLLTSCSQPDPPESLSIIPSRPAVPSVGDNASLGVNQDPGTVVTQPLVVLLLLVATLVVGVVGYVVWANTDAADESDEEPPEPDDEGNSGPDARVVALGNVAGDVADRLERNATTENEVFRAWVEMTELLAVDHPRSSTPAEFANAAVDAGISPDDVAELTALFEEVRYGGEPVTADRERRAVDALRHIEDEYGDDS